MTVRSSTDFETAVEARRDAQAIEGSPETLPLRHKNWLRTRFRLQQPCAKSGAAGTWCAALSRGGVKRLEGGFCRSVECEVPTRRGEGEVLGPTATMHKERFVGRMFDHSLHGAGDGQR